MIIQVLNKEDKNYKIYKKWIFEGFLYIRKIENVKAPRIAIEYYNLPDDARLVDLVKCVKADEEHHSEINHKYADEEIG